MHKYSRQRKSRQVSTILSIIGLALILSACDTSETTTNKNDAAIAVVYPLSGQFAADGQLALTGAEIAAEEINAQGGIKALGRTKLRLIVEDAGQSTESAVTATTRALGQKPAAATGIYVSSFTLAATQVAERRRIPWVTGSFADTVTQRGFKFTFTTSPSQSTLVTDGAGTILKKYFHRPTRKLRVALIGDNTAASIAFVDAMRPLIKSLNSEIVVEKIWSPPLADGDPIAHSVAAAKADVILLTVVPFADVTRILRALPAAGVTAPIVGNGAPLLNPELLNSVGANALEKMFVLVASHPGRGTEQLVKTFTERAKVPFVNQVGLFGYYNTWLIAAAMESAASTDPLKVAEALRTIDLTSGPVADILPGDRIQFDERGQRIGAIPVITQWQSGLPVVVYPDELATAEAITTTNELQP